MDSNAEIFNQKRMDRCGKIQRSIMVNWQNTNQFFYIVRATESLEGCSFDELRKKYFAVGVSDDDLQELPLIDVLVIFSMIIQECAELEKRKGKDEKDFTIKYKIKTEYSDDETAQILSQMRIETPFDEGNYLRISAG